jgi:hypothetical protein
LTRARLELPIVTTRFEVARLALIAALAWLPRFVGTAFALIAIALAAIARLKRPAFVRSWR